MLAGLLAAVPAAIWVYLVSSRGGFWRTKRHLLPDIQAKVSQPVKITAVIPARNEADVIGTAVRSLLTQQLPEPLQVIVVDDGSTDGTAEAASKAASIAEGASRLAVIPGEPLVSGWTGKLWALSQGIAIAQVSAPDYILLTDADIEHGAGTVARLLTVAQIGNYDLASLMVLLATETAAEKLLIPAFVYFFLQLYPPAWIANRNASTAGAAGGCILIRADVLRRIGGLAPISGEVIDDCALAVLVKRNGGAIWLGLTSETKSLRSYGGFGGVGAMISRSAFNQLRHSSLLLLLTLVGLAATYVAPTLLLFSRYPIARILGGTAWLLMAISFRPTLRLYRQPAVSALLLPAIAIYYAGVTVHSAVRYWQGTGGEWKGRIQDAKQSRALS